MSAQIKQFSMSFLFRKGNCYLGFSWDVCFSLVCLFSFCMKNSARDGIPALIVKTTLNVRLFRLRNGATEFAIM